MPSFYFGEYIINFMKSILSPYDDFHFNEFLLKYIKKRLKRHIAKIKDEDSKYYLDDSRKYFTPEDILNSLSLNGRVIYFNNRNLINHAVYDLSQRFWFDEFKTTNNMIRKIYLEYKRLDPEFQQSKLSREKKSTYVR